MANEPKSRDFGDALRRALLGAGITLDEAATQLQRRGHEITTATLAHWQSGVLRPGRSTSRSSVEDLETILGTVAGALTGYLGVLGQAGAPEEAFPLSPGPQDYPARIAQLHRALGLDGTLGTRPILIEDEVHLDASGTPRREISNHLLQAVEDDVASFIVGHIDFAGYKGPGVVTAQGRGHVAATAIDRHLRIIATRIDLDTPAKKGEIFRISVTTDFPHAHGRAHTMERWTEYPLSEHVVCVVFHPDMVASDAQSFLSPTARDFRHAELRPARWSDNDVIKTTHLDISRGTSGLLWAFPGQTIEDAIAHEEITPAPMPEVLAAWQRAVVPHEAALPSL